MLEEIDSCANQSLFVGCATLRMPVSLYIESQQLPCILKRKKPNKPTRKPGECEFDYGIREAQYYQEISDWGKGIKVQEWLDLQRLKYESLEDHRLGIDQWHADVKRWYESSLYKKRVAEADAQQIVYQLEALLLKNCRGDLSASRDLFGHFEHLKKRLPSYKIACVKQISKVNQRPRKKLQK